MSKTIIGIMGPGDASETDVNNGFEMGKMIAEQGWVLLTGGREEGVMGAANKGAMSKGGLTIGVLPSSNTKGMSADVDIPIITDMGSGRNNINVLSSNVVVACGIAAGTASEIALAIKAGKMVILLCDHDEGIAFFRSIGSKQLIIAHDPNDAMIHLKNILEI